MPFEFSTSLLGHTTSSKWTQCASRKDQIEVARSELVDANVKLLASGQGTDLTITCGCQTFRVHKAIVCPRSEFFAAACWGKFKEADADCIDLPEDDPEVFSKLVWYLYSLQSHQDCPCGVGPDVTESKLQRFASALSDQASLYIMSDKYGIEGLKSVLTFDFKTTLRHSFDQVIGKRPSQIPNLLSHVSPAIEAIYSGVPSLKDPLRVAILEFFKHHLGRLLDLDLELFQDLLAQVPELSYDLLVSAVAFQSVPTSSYDAWWGGLPAVDKRWQPTIAPYNQYGYIEDSLWGTSSSPIPGSVFDEILRSAP